VQVLGSLRIDGGGVSIDHWSSRKSHLLLAYLASEPRRVVTKEALTDLFWPDCASARAANNLSIAIHQIRSWLRPLIPFQPNGIRVQQGLYSLDPAVTWLVDIGEMRLQLAQARVAAHAGDVDKAREHNLSAVRVYSGEFLASDPYEEWTIEPRRAAEQEICVALRWLAADAASLGDWTSALQHASQCIQHDPCDEEAYRALMTGYWKQGNRALALQNYRSLERALRSDLSITPSDETIALARSIARDGAHPGIEAVGANWAAP
jgi:DNA-binding SARP family transcriptional activator